MTDLKISQFTDGGIIEETDIIAAVRSGVNTKVTVGSAATADIGSADAEIPDGYIVNQKIADALAVYTPPPSGDGNYGVITISSGVWDFTDGSYGDVSISGNDMEITNAPLASIKNLTTSANQGIRLTATDTYATYSLTDGGVALSGITGTALTIPYFPSTDTVGNLTFIDDDTFATATSTSLSSSESIKAYVDASAGVTPFTKYHESGGHTITAGGLITIAHNFGFEPKLVQPFLVCITAQFNYSVGDELPINHFWRSGSIMGGCAVQYDDTNVYARIAAGVRICQCLNWSTGAEQDLTNANWQLLFRIWG